MSPSQIMPLVGIRIIPDSNMVERIQTRFPRSKKKRVQKKFRKDAKNWATKPMMMCYQMGDMMIMHPALLGQLKRRVVTMRES